MKQNKTIVALTGSISTGKSTVSKKLVEKGYFLIDSDEIGHNILNKKKIVEEIRLNLGEDFIDNNKVNRKKLSKFVFENRENLKILNSITHKEIFKEINHKIKTTKENLIFVDIPLLVELLDELLNYGFKYDYLWLVYSDPEIQLSRLMKRDNISKEEALSKINSQMAIKDKKRFADYIIYNNNGIEELEKEIERALDYLKKIIA